MENKKLDVPKYLKMVDELLDATRPLAEVHIKTKKKAHFLRVLEAIYRKNYFSMLSLRMLVQQEELSDSGLVIARGILEDAIYVEFMLAENKEKAAKKFKRFIWVQLHQTSEFLQELNKNPEEFFKEQIKEIEQEYEKVKEEFWHKPSNQPLRSWSGKNFDQMLVDLVKNKKLGEFDNSRTIMGYVYGSWKTHLNPYDVVGYLLNETREIGQQQARDLAIVFGMTSFIRLTTRYIDEIRYTKNKNVFENVAKVVNRIFSTMDSDGE